jgi:hypothetical protein
MSYPSGSKLMQQIVEDDSLPIEARLEAIRESSFRPTLSGLLRLIRNTSTPARLKAAAVIRFNQLAAIREVTRGRRQTRGKKVEEAVNPAAELLGADRD